MFTGLVEEVAPVVSVTRRGEITRVAISSRVAASDAAVGDSISVNGCCLTVVAVAYSPDSEAASSADQGWVVEFDLVPETIARTNLGELQPATFVNLERSLRPTTRLGGHWVTGHIDGLATIEALEDHHDWRKIWFRGQDSWMNQLASRGSVAIDGISLTLVDVQQERFSVVLIPHTLVSSNIGSRQTGDRVNVETDLLAKYVERQLAAYRNWSPRH